MYILPYKDENFPHKTFLHQKKKKGISSKIHNKFQEPLTILFRGKTPKLKTVSTLTSFLDISNVQDTCK